MAERGKNKTTKKMNEVGQKLFKESSKQAASLEGAMRHLQDILKNIESSSDNANFIVELAEKSKNEVIINKKKIVSLKQLFEVIKQFQGNLKNISELIYHIKEKSEYLEAIALKSEKLSYNAEIEAARSGEDTARFSVIAEEIRNLTDLNRNAATDISSIVQECVSTVGKYSSEIRHTLQEGHVIISDVDGAFKGIEGEITSMVHKSQEITDNSQSQIDATKRVNETVKTEIENYSQLISELLGDITGNKISNISCEEAHKRLSEYTILDVRGIEEYLIDLGRIKNSANHPVNQELSLALEHYDRSKKYLFVCRSGGRSARAARIAQGLGFEHVFNLEGGMLRWCELKLPTIPPQKKAK